MWVVVPVSEFAIAISSIRSSSSTLWHSSRLERRNELPLPLPLPLLDDEDGEDGIGDCENANVFDDAKTILHTFHIYFTLKF